MIRVAINGYGRIGRVAHRVIIDKFSDQVDVVAINSGSSTDLKGWMYLLKYDSIYGTLKNNLSVSESGGEEGVLGTLSIDGKEIKVFSQKDPGLLPWGDLGIDVVIESTGHFLTQEKAEKHIQAGARKVVLSAPEKGEGIETYVVSVNEKDYSSQNIISCASCTTNSIAPVAKIMEEAFGVEKAMLTTIHGYTSDQRLHDGGHKDYRRARAAGLNIVPTSTGATQAAAKVIPSLKDKFAGLSLRVPVPVGSLSDLTFVLKREVTKEDVNQRLHEASVSPDYKGILAVTNDPIVSSDVVGLPYSSLVDLSLTQVVGGNMVKVVAWYDNEYGYANRLVEEVVMVGQTS